MGHHDSGWWNKPDEHSEDDHEEYRHLDGQAAVVIDDSRVIDSFAG